MAEMSGARTLFDLPLELREQIYKDALSSPSQGPALLRTCREISSEARKCLYQRPINLASQGDLCDWSTQTPPELLLHVCEIGLHVQDIDLKPILTSDISESAHSSPRLLTRELYEQEVHRIEQAFRRLPKLKIITLRALPGRPSFLYREFVAEVLNILSATCLELLDLRLGGNFHHQDLSFLSDLATLRAFSFDGFSLSSPTTTANVLASLPLLSSLSLISERAPPSPDADPDSDFPAAQQSLTGEVVRTMKNLASFSVTERIPIASPTIFFTSDLLASLHSHQTLTSIAVNLSHPPDTQILRSLGEFLATTLIERLELDWPNLHAAILEQHQLLYASLKVLRIRARSKPYAISILSSVAGSLEAKDAISLSKVVLLRRKEQAQDRSGDMRNSGTESVDFEAHEVSFSPDYPFVATCL
jgi:hypothetical protein